VISAAKTALKVEGATNQLTLQGKRLHELRPQFGAVECGTPNRKLGVILLQKVSLVRPFLNPEPRTTLKT